MIPAAAVETAALILHTHGGLTVAEARERAGLILEAAAPHMQGEAWESGYTLGYADCANKQESNRPNPYKEEV